nr:hypothetical protein [Bacteroidota bacterium]
MKTLQLLQHSVTNSLKGILISVLLFTLVQNASSQIPDSDLSKFEPAYNKSPELDYDCVYPPVWNTVINTGAFANPHLMVINDIGRIMINGTGVNECDYIGAFYTDNNGELKCAGADYFQNNGIIFAIFGDIPSTPEKEGFGYSDTIVFKLFSWSCAGGKTIDVSTVEISEGWLHWYPLGFTIINNINCQTAFECQFSDIEQGMETSPDTSSDNWYHFTCPVNHLSVQDFYDQTGGRLKMIKEKYGSKVFWPEKGIFTLEELESGKVYLLKFE